MPPDATIIEFRKARDAGDVLNVTFRYIRQNAWLLGKSLLYIVGPMMAVVLILNSYFQVQMFSMAGLGGAPIADDEALRMMGRMVGPWIGIMVVSVAATTMAVVVVYAHMILYQDRGPGGFEVADVWAIARENFFRILVTGFVLSLVVLLPILIVIIPCLGALAYLVWLAYAAATFSLLFPLRMREGIGMGEALGRCRTLVKGSFWQTFGVVFLAVILYSVLSTVLSLPATILGLTVGFGSASGEPGWLAQTALFVFQAVGMIGGTVFYCIPLVAIAFQYFNLVEGQERVGLMQRVGQVSEEAGMGAEAVPASNPFAPRPAASAEGPPDTADPSAPEEGAAAAEEAPPRSPYAPPGGEAVADPGKTADREAAAGSEAGKAPNDEAADESSDDERRWGPRRAE